MTSITLEVGMDVHIAYNSHFGSLRGHSGLKTASMASAASGPVHAIVGPIIQQGR